MTRSPEAVLEQLLQDAEAMRRRGFGPEADRMAQVAEEFRLALEPIALIHEDQAMMRTGRRRAWLRQRFATWCKLGSAELRDGERYYRLCVLPSRLAVEQGQALAVALLRERREVA